MRTIFYYLLSLVPCFCFETLYWDFENRTEEAGKIVYKDRAGKSEFFVEVAPGVNVEEVNLEREKYPELNPLTSRAPLFLGKKSLLLTLPLEGEYDFKSFTLEFNFIVKEGGSSKGVQTVVGFEEYYPNEKIRNRSEWDHRGGFFVQYSPENSSLAVMSYMVKKFELDFKIEKEKLYKFVYVQYQSFGVVYIDKQIIKIDKIYVPSTLKVPTLSIGGRKILDSFEQMFQGIIDDFRLNPTILESEQFLMNQPKD